MHYFNSNCHSAVFHHLYSLKLCYFVVFNIILFSIFHQQMTDANQVWDVQETVEWMKQLAEVKPLWIEEPTSPDDILGHAAISEVFIVSMHRHACVVL